MKLKYPARAPAELEAIGRMTQADFEALAPLYVAAQIERAEKRLAARPQRSEDVPQGAFPPPTNRGGKLGEAPFGSVKLVLEGGVIKEVPQRRGWGGDTAFIDWVNLTIGEETLGGGVTTPVTRMALVDGEVKEVESTVNESPVTPDQVMICLSNRLNNIFGFGITSKREMGANFYRESWVIGDDWGMVCYGGQRQTIMVTLNGSGCAAAKEGWEIRLKQFLESAQRARLTRVDFAHDDYTGQTYNVNKADEDHTAGLFNCGGRNPDCEYRGNWKNPNGKGRTFNVGNRSNGKFARIYEKGRQLGDKDSDWVRIEVEFKAVDRVIPFDCLLRPGEYLAAAYPAFVWISERQERIFTTQRVVQATVDKAVAWIRHQCGPSIKEMVALFGFEDFLKKVTRDGKQPSWSKVPQFLLSPDSIHQQKREIHPVNLSAAATAW